MLSEVETKADFSKVRYAQCWEDADVVLEAMNVQPHHTCLSIASAGDNTLAILSKGPRKVIALDLSAAQLACLELRVAAYKELTHPELLSLIGVSNDFDRMALYQRCRQHLSVSARSFWNIHLTDLVAEGLGHVGKFENYFRLFRQYLLPLVHSAHEIQRLLTACDEPDRLQFYHRQWNTWEWRFMFKLFFSRTVMGLLGRDPSFFAYVQESVSTFLLKSTAYALTALDPSENPYLQWILLGTYKTALPYALRPENFDAIKANIDRLEWRRQSLEDFLDESDLNSIDSYNLSDVFEYMSLETYHALLEKLIAHGSNGARLVYWNMLAERSRPVHMATRLRPQTALSDKLLLKNKTFFYSRFVVEEVTK